MLWKCYTQYVSKFGKLSSGHRRGKGQFSFQFQRMYNYHIIALILHASKVMLKILQARPQQYMNRILPDVQAGFRKGKGTRDQIASIHWILEKTREFQKNIYFCFIHYAKAFDYMDHNKLWKILKEMGNQTTWLASWETYMHVRKQQLELDMNNRLAPNRKRSMSRLYIVTLLI